MQFGNHEKNESSNRTLFENHSKCLIRILVFFIIFFVSLKVICLVTLFEHKLQDLFGIFYELLYTQNVSVAGNVE